MSNKNSNNIKGRMDQILHPIPAILYLAKDRSCSPPHRYSKIQALADLVEHEFRCRQEEEKVSLNLSHLAKRWNWARPTVISYANTLHEMGGFLLEDSKQAKRFFVNPAIYRWEDLCEDSPNVTMEALHDLHLPMNRKIRKQNKNNQSKGSVQMRLRMGGNCSLS